MPNGLSRVEFLLGEWDGHETGKAGVGVGIAAIAFVSGTWWLMGVAASLLGAGLFDLLPKRAATIEAET